MSASNSGKWLEKEIKRICALYQEQGWMRLEKVDPPTLRIGGKTIFQKSPFLDFIGTWTERAGRALIIEAKSTDKPILTIQNSGGISEAQWDNMQLWAAAGAAVGVLWGDNDTKEIRFCPLHALQAQMKMGIKHLKWHNATPIPKGASMETFDCFDFIRTLREYHP